MSDSPPAAAEPEKPLLRGVSHQVAAIVAATLAPLMIVRAPGIAPRFIVGLYVVAIVGLFGVDRKSTRLNSSHR